MNQSNQDQDFYLDWIRHICDVHRSNSWSKARNREQVAEEDRINEPWEDLDAAHHQRLRGLAADLNNPPESEWPYPSD